jgi:ribosomal protein L13
MKVDLITEDVISADYETQTLVANEYVGRLATELANVLKNKEGLLLLML